MATVALRTSTLLEISERPTGDRKDSFVNAKLHQKGVGVLDVWGFKSQVLELSHLDDLPTEGALVDASVNFYVKKEGGRLQARLQSLTPPSGV